MSKGVKLMNAISGMMDQGDNAKRRAVDQAHGPIQRAKGSQHLQGEEGDADGMEADHEDQGEGEGFGIDELETKAKDLHNHVMKIKASRGGQRGEHS